MVTPRCITDPDCNQLWVVVGPSQYDPAVQARYMVTGDLFEAVHRLRRLEEEMPANLLTSDELSRRI